MILTYGKIEDEVRDSGFFRALPWRAAALFLKPAYKKAAGRAPDFAETVRRELASLDRLEAEKTASLDAAADTFAVILREAGGDPEGGSRSRVLRELLYHIGRIIYVLDAVDDLRDDHAKGHYNPLLYRFKVTDGALSDEDSIALRTTLTHSHNSICAAYALLEATPYSGILDNIIYYGLPAAVEAVFTGQWKALQQKHRGRNRL